MHRYSHSIELREAVRYNQFISAALHGCTKVFPNDKLWSDKMTTPNEPNTGILAINGGAKSCDHQWPAWPIWDDAERVNLSNVLESGSWWFGERVHQFEREYAKFQGANFGITVSNGTTALEAAFMALGIGAGDEVIVPPYTFLATASAVLRVNAIPVFADIEPDTLCIDPVDVEWKITDKTKAIVPVHFGGYMADMDRLTAIAKAHGLLIVEDACHAWGSQWKGKGAGTLGSCGVFSFQASKNISSGEGGIIVTDDEGVADACASVINCGRIKGGEWYKHYVMASNLRITEFQAAILLAQLSRLEAQTLKRMENAAILDDALAGIPGISLTKPEPRMTRRSYHMYTLRLDSSVLGISREQFIAACQAEGVPIGTGYPIPLYRQPVFESFAPNAAGCPVTCGFYGRHVDYASVSCPVCEQVCEDTCWISHQALLADGEAVLSIGAAIRKVCDNTKELK